MIALGCYVEREDCRGYFNVESRGTLGEIELDRLAVEHLRRNADARERARDLRIGEFTLGQFEREGDVLGVDGRTVIERQAVVELDDHSLGARQKRPGLRDAIGGVDAFLFRIGANQLHLMKAGEVGGAEARLRWMG